MFIHTMYSCTHPLQCTAGVHTGYPWPFLMHGVLGVCQETKEDHDTALIYRIYLNIVFIKIIIGGCFTLRNGFRNDLPGDSQEYFTEKCGSERSKTSIAYIYNYVVVTKMNWMYSTVLRYTNTHIHMSRQFEIFMYGWPLSVTQGIWCWTVKL